MIGIKLLLLLSFFFFQGIRGYCIYNKLTDGSSFRVTQISGTLSVPKRRRFSKHMEKDTTECCPYTTEDCAALMKNKLALFVFEFYFIDQPPFSLRSVRCTTHGGLTIHGTKEKYYAECNNGGGVTQEVPIWNFDKEYL